MAVPTSSRPPRATLHDFVMLNTLGDTQAVEAAVAMRSDSRQRGGEPRPAPAAVPAMRCHV